MFYVEIKVASHHLDRDSYHDNEKPFYKDKYNLCGIERAILHCDCDQYSFVNSVYKSAVCRMKRRIVYKLDMNDLVRIFCFLK